MEQMTINIKLSKENTDYVLKNKERKGVPYAVTIRLALEEYEKNHPVSK